MKLIMVENEIKLNILDQRSYDHGRFDVLNGVDFW